MNQIRTEDDLTQILGIGKACAGRLNAAGVCTYQQLSEMTTTQIAPLVADIPGMSPERMAELDWPGQARRLVAAQEEAGETAVANGQHYARFNIELLLSDHNAVRRTRIQKRPDGPANEWSGWKQGRLEAFIAANARLPEPTPPEQLSGHIQLRRLGVQDAETERTCLALHGPQPFRVTLEAELSNLTGGATAQTTFAANVYAKRLGDGQRMSLGTTSGLVEQDSSEIIASLPGKRLEPGIYRLEAAFTLARQPVGEFLNETMKGNLLQVF